MLKSTQSLKSLNPEATDQDIALANKKLVPLFGNKRIWLDCLTIRPNIAGKKTVGLLDCM